MKDHKETQWHDKSSIRLNVLASIGFLLSWLVLLGLSRQHVGLKTTTKMIAKMVGSECGCVSKALRQHQDRPLHYFACCPCHSGWHHKSHLFSDPTETRAEITAKNALPATAVCWILIQRSLIKQTGSSLTDYWTKRLLSVRLEGADWFVSKAQTLASTVESQINNKEWCMHMKVIYMYY